MINRVFISGGTGFIGKKFVSAWLSASRENEIIVQTRFPERFSDDERCRHVSALSEVDLSDKPFAIVNLAGAPIADGRWTKHRKALIEKSRIDLTQSLYQCAQKGDMPQILVNASAIGIYQSGEQWLDENSAFGRGFSSMLCQNWENAALQFENHSRVVRLRFGVVLGKEGMLKKLLPLYKMGLGGPIGSGEQWLSWVHVDDVVQGIFKALATSSMEGPYNMTAPNPVRQREFASALAGVLHRPAIVPTPAIALKAIYGQMAQELLIEGHRVAPARLQDEGFEFKYESLKAALLSCVQV